MKSSTVGFAVSSVATVNVVAKNAPPRANGETVDLPPNNGPLDVPASSGLLPNDSDPDGDPLQVLDISVDGLPGPVATGTPLEIPGKGTLLVRPDGSYSFTPLAEFTGALSVNYTVSDGRGGTAVATLTLRSGTTMGYHNDDPEVYLPPEATFADAPPVRKQPHIYVEPILLVAVNQLGSLHGTLELDNADGVVLDATNAVLFLNGTALVRGSGVVVQAANGLDSLHSVDAARDTSPPDASQPPLLDRLTNSSIHSLGSEPSIAASLLTSSGLQLELIADGDRVWIEVISLDPVRQVRAALADGSPLPAWVKVDEHGNLMLDRPADAERLRLRLTVETQRGSPRTQVIEIDFVSGQMQEVNDGPGTADAPRAAPLQRSSERSALPPAPQPVADFATQLTQAVNRNALDAKLLELLS